VEITCSAKQKKISITVGDTNLSLTFSRPCPLQHSPVKLSNLCLTIPTKGRVLEQEALKTK
jgi:hypothetical protein